MLAPGAVWRFVCWKQNMSLRSIHQTGIKGEPEAICFTQVWLLRLASKRATKNTCWKKKNMVRSIVNVWHALKRENKKQQRMMNHVCIKTFVAISARWGRYIDWNVVRCPRLERKHFLRLLYEARRSTKYDVVECSKNIEAALIFLDIFGGRLDRPLRHVLQYCKFTTAATLIYCRYACLAGDGKPRGGYSGRFQRTLWAERVQARHGEGAGKGRHVCHSLLLLL